MSGLSFNFGGGERKVCLPGSGYGWKIQWAPWLTILQEPDCFSRSLLSESLDHLLSCPTASVISQVLFSGQVWWHFSVGPSQGVLCDSFYLFFFEAFQRLQVLVFLPRFISSQVDPLFPILCCEIVRSGISTSLRGRRIYLGRLFPSAVEDDYKFYTAPKDRRYT